MAKDDLSGKLAVILHADVAGSTQLVQQDEQLAHERIRDAFRSFSDTIEKYHGRVQELRGDALLAEFDRASDAVTAALSFQLDHHDHLEKINDDIQPEIRVGIALGEVVIADSTVTGAGVVLAQRVEQLAEPGGLCITSAIHEALPNRLPFSIESLGEQALKGFEEHVRVYRVQLSTGESVPPPQQIGRRQVTLKKRWQRSAIVAVVVLVALGVGYWSKYSLPQEEPASIERMAFPLPDKPSIAVLPFTNMSNDAGQEYFTDGMTEDLITDLSKISGLFVIARNSSFSYKGQQVKVRQVAEDLGVRYVLEGSVRRVGDQVRINAQLIDATTGGHLWAERYDGSLQDIFAMQDEVTQKIVTALVVSLTTGEQERQAQKETDSLEAYDAFLRGWMHYRLRTPGDFAKAIPYLKNAIELDPNYGRAHAALTAVYWEGSASIWAKSLGVSNNEAYEKAKRHLEEALKHPTPLAYRMAAQMVDPGGRWDEAMAEAERAITLDANDPNGYVAMGRLLVKVGRPAEGLEFIEMAMRLDPRSDYLYQLGDAQFHLERFEEAAATLLRATKRNPGDEWNFFLLAAAYGQLGREKEAKSAIETFNNVRLKAQQRPYTLTDIDYWTFKKPDERERLRNGLRKAGLRGGATVPQRTSLTSVLLNSLLPGNTAIGETVFGDGGYVYHLPDGKLLIRTFNGQTDQGTWEITEDGQVCRQWNNFGDGKKTCFIYFTKGDEYEYWYPDGSKMRGKFKLRVGNPENL
jgi:TolB-like protein/class 3 adenylate cyclase